MVTLKDVAARAGVAAGTVSNVLNNPSLVRPETRRRVEQAIAELGFVRNESAREPRRGRSSTIALVVPDIANPFFDDVAAGADDLADQHDAMVLVSSSANSPDRERRHLERLGRQRLLGVVHTPLQEPPWNLVDAVEAQGTPVVFVDHLPESRPWSAAVTVDDHLGGQLVGRHLLDAGHDRITYLAPYCHQTRARLAGLRAAVDGLAVVEVLRCPDMSLRAGVEAFEALTATRSTAVFCGNDVVAVGLLGECRRRGVRVPEDLAVVGYDDVDLAAATQITTVAQPRRRLGARAVEVVLGRAEDEHRSVFRPRLVVRSTSGPGTPGP